jgi:hypothetical protein
MPLPAAHDWGTTPDYGVIGTDGDNGLDATSDTDNIAGARVNKMSADIIALHDAESARRGYATALTAAEALGASAHDKVYTNTGAVSAVADRAVTLPSDAGCKRVSFYDDGPGLRVLANTGQTIRVGLGPANVSKSGGYIESNGEGAFITLFRISANKWAAVSTLDWAVEVS